MGVYFIVCTLCVICLLHEGRSGADQCDQDTRPTSIVGKNKEKIRTQIVKSVRIRSYATEDIANCLYKASRIIASQYNYRN